MIYNLSKYNQDWNVFKLTELGNFSRGKSKHRPRNDKKLFENGKYPLIQTSDIKKAVLFVEEHSQAYNDFGLKQSKMWDSETLCITIAANIAETAIIKYPMCFPDSIVGFRASSKTSEIFMHYIFCFIQKHIKNIASGSIQDNINIEYLTSLKFKIPNKEYQDKILDILYTVDKKISLNNRIIAKLEEMAKTIYDYWFLQFDFPNDEGKPYRQSGGAMKYSEKLGRDIPIDWEVKNVSHFCDVLTGSEDANFATTKGKYKFFTCSQEVYQCNISAFEGNAILVAGNGDFNVKHYSGEFNAYQRTYVLLPQKPYYALLYFSIQKRILHFKAGSNGSIVKFIRKGDIENIPILYPNNQKVLNILNNFIFAKEQKMRENEKLAELRDWLLPMLMNGQVRVE